MTPLVINITAQNNTGPGVAAATAQVASLNNAVQGTATATASGSAATSTLARNMLNLAQVADDAQYGFRAIVNQIPMLVQGFGLGMGVAGALQMAGVAYSILSTHVWGTEKALNKETETLREASAEARKKAVASREAAEAANALEEGTAAAAERLEAIAESYKKATAAADVHLSSLRAEVALQKELREAQQARALAEVDAKEATGQYGAREAAEARRTIKGQGAEANLAEDEKIAAGEIAAAEQKRQAARRKAAELEAERRRTEAARGLIFDEDTRKAMEDSMSEAGKTADSETARADAAEKAKKDVPKPAKDAGFWEYAWNTLKGNVKGEGVNNQEANRREAERLAEEEKRARQSASNAADRERALKPQLEADRAAREALGVGGAEDLEKRRQQIEKDIAAAREAEAAAARERDASKARIDTRRQVAGLERETSTFEGEAERGRFTRAEEAEAAKAAEAAAREAARADRAGERRGGMARRVRNVVEDSGVQGRAAAALQQGIAAFESGQDDGGALAGMLDRFEKMLGQLQKRTGDKGDRAKLERIMRRIDELEAQIRNDRD